MVRGMALTARAVTIDRASVTFRHADRRSATFRTPTTGYGWKSDDVVLRVSDDVVLRVSGAHG